MKRLEDYPQGNLAILLVGDQKTGKSRILASFPGMYVLDFDNNLRSVINAGCEGLMYDDPCVDEFDKKIDRGEAWPNMIKQIQQAIKDPAVKAIALDSLTVAFEYLKDYVLAKAIRTEGKILQNLRMQDWEIIRKEIFKLVTFMRAIKIPVIWTCHQQYDKDEITGLITYSLSIQGQLKSNLGSMFTDVWGTDARRTNSGVEYVLETGPKHRSVALGSSAKMPLTLDLTNKNPKQIWELLNKYLNIQA